jgi:hypothetical protein
MIERVANPNITNLPGAKLRRRDDMDLGIIIPAKIIDSRSAEARPVNNLPSRQEAKMQHDDPRDEMNVQANASDSKLAWDAPTLLSLGDADDVMAATGIGADGGGSMVS